MNSQAVDRGTFLDFEWKRDYRTSSRDAVDILDQFYSPLLERTVSYDRVAGYFRSTSIKAAIRGFGHFSTKGGKARFVVGADMDGADVDVLTKEKDDLLVLKINKEIDSLLADERVDNQPNAVELLAWMVWRGSLDIKVAIVDRNKGDTDRFDGRNFAYAHEKWAVVTDVTGRRIGFAGSLNESRTAMQENAENISVFCDWKGEDPSARIRDMAVDFEHLWEGKHSVLKVFDLPEAVRRNLIKIGERTDQHLRKIRAETSMFHLSDEERLGWIELRSAPRTEAGRFIGINTAPVEPWPHQEFVGRRIVESYPRSVIAADEVGLGKTIEIGLAIRALVLSGRASRILVIPPATLTRQWQVELKEKFLLPFVRCDGQKKHIGLDDEGEDIDASSSRMFQPDLMIVSSKLYERKDVVAQFEKGEDWDLIVLDEAQYANKEEGQEDPDPFDPRSSKQKHGDTNLRYAIRAYAVEKSPAIVLATATPMQVRRQQAYDLMRLTGLSGSFIGSDGTSDAFYEAVMRIKDGAPGLEADEAFVRAFVREVQANDPEYFKFCRRFYAKGVEQPFRKWLDGDPIAKAARTSSGRQSLCVILHAMAPLSRVMLRHGRELLREYKRLGILRGNLANRHVRAVSVQMTPGEQEVYERLEDYCRALKQTIEVNAPAGLGKRLSSQTNFFLSFLRLRFASSTYAAWLTLRRRRDRVAASISWLQERRDTRTPELDVPEDDFDKEDDDDREYEGDLLPDILPNRSIVDLKEEQYLLEALVAAFDALDPEETISSKDRSLFRLIEDRHNVVGSQTNQTIIFTRFGETMDHIVRNLRSALGSAPMATFSGRGGHFYEASDVLGRPMTRTNVKESFLDGRVSILVCTDAAAEGLNLQVSDLLVNFDLPWNPAKVEQRIGRIDRIGQKHDDITVANMAYDGSAELEVYARLLERLDDANLIVGTQQIALLPISETDFRKLADRSTSETARQAILDKAEAEARAVSAAYRQREMDVERVAQIHIEMQKRWWSENVVGLQDTWNILTTSQALIGSGANVAENGVFHLPVIPGVVDREMRFTVDLPTYQRGGVSFATWGDPEFDELLAVMSGTSAPDGVTPIERQEAIAKSKERRRKHWKLSRAHRGLLDAVVLDFTSGLKGKPSVKSWRDEIRGRMKTSDTVKQVRFAEGTFGNDLPSVVLSMEGSARTSRVPRQIVEIAAEEAVERVVTKTPLPLLQ